MAIWFAVGIAFSLNVFVFVLCVTAIFIAKVSLRYLSYDTLLYVLGIQFPVFSSGMLVMILAAFSYRSASLALNVRYTGRIVL